MTTTHTRTDAETYVRATLGGYARDFDVDAIVTDLYDQVGHFDFTVLDHQDVPTVDFWATVGTHALPLPPLPSCPAWCDQPTGHPYDGEEPDGGLIGDHRGTLQAMTDDAGNAVGVEFVQLVHRDADGTVSISPVSMFLTTSGDFGAEYTDPHHVRDLVDQLRKAAGVLEGADDRSLT